MPCPRLTWARPAYKRVRAAAYLRRRSLVLPSACFLFPRSAGVVSRARAPADFGRSRVSSASRPAGAPFLPSGSDQASRRRALRQELGERLADHVGKRPPLRERD